MKKTRFDPDNEIVVFCMGILATIFAFALMFFVEIVLK